MPKPKSSGAQNRKRKAEREAAGQADVRTLAAAAGVPLAGDEESETCAAEFDALLERYPEGSAGFAAAAHELATRQMLRSRRVTPEDKWKLLDKMSGTHGLMQNRNELEELAGRLEGILAGIRPAGALKMQSTESLPRAPGSRGAARGPKPVDEG